MYFWFKPHVLFCWIRNFEFVQYCLEHWNISCPMGKEHSYVKGSTLRSCVCRFSFTHWDISPYLSCCRLRMKRCKWWTHSWMCRGTSLQPLQESQTVVLIFAVLYCLCALNRLTTQPILWVRTLWVFYPCLCVVYIVLQKFKSLYFSFCNVFKGNRIFIVGILLLWSKVSHQYLLT